MDRLGGHYAKGNEKDKHRIRRYKPDTSLVVQWFDPWSGNKDPTGCRVTKSMSHNQRAGARPLLSPHAIEPGLHKRKTQARLGKAQGTQRRAVAAKRREKGKKPLNIK